LAHERSEFDCEGIGCDYIQPPGINGGKLRERGEAALVAFDRDHIARTVRKQCAREAPGPRPDFHNSCISEWTRGARNAGRQVEIEEEMLAE
jgi:hypothetical protein